MTSCRKQPSKLYKRSITFYEPAHKRNGKPLPPTMVQMRWVGSVKVPEGEGWVELAWWPDLLRHLIGLKAQFTTYQLQQASALRSAYSWKLLELLTRFQSTGKAEYTIEDFKASMDAPPSLSDFGQVKRRIIDPAVKELTEKDGWLIQWVPVKAGRKVKALRFTFMRDPQGRFRTLTLHQACFCRLPVSNKSPGTVKPASLAMVLISSCVYPCRRSPRR